MNRYIISTFSLQIYGKIKQRLIFIINFAHDFLTRKRFSNDKY